MADISLAEMNESLGSAGDFLVDAANAARRSLCRAYKKYPGAIVGSRFDNPVTQAYDGLARRLCEPIDELPEDASEPVPGGQCLGRLYSIVYRYRNTPSDSWIVASPVQRNGAVGGLTLKRTSDTAMQITLFHSVGAGGSGGTEEALGFVSGETGTIGSAEIVSITPVDGLPDECGDTPPTYPINPADAGDIVKPEPLPSGGRTVNVPVTINPVKVDVGVQIKPEFNINVGGVQVNLNITGAKISITPTFNFNPVLPPALDPRPDPPPPVAPPQDPDQEGGETGESLDEILDELEEIKEIAQATRECACEEDPETNLVPDLLGSGNSGCFNLPARVKLVRLSINTQPTNARFENGMSAPNVLYAGWSWFEYLNGLSVRTPIDSAEKTFLVESENEAQRFCFTCRVGFSATVTAYVEQEVIEG